MQTEDTSILELLAFVNSVGLLRCAGLVKSEDGIGEKLVLNAVPNVR